MKNEIKVGDCFKSSITGSIWIVAGFKNKRAISVIRVSTCIDSPLVGEDFFNEHYTPITRAEFDAALGARFAAIKAELPEVK